MASTKPVFVRDTYPFTNLEGNVNYPYHQRKTNPFARSGASDAPPKVEANPVARAVFWFVATFTVYLWAPC